MRAVEQRTGGAIEVHAGTLYRAINRLLSQGLVVELDRRPGSDSDDERRRYYRVTPLGLGVLGAEACRLESQVLAASHSTQSRRLEYLPRTTCTLADGRLDIEGMGVLTEAP